MITVPAYAEKVSTFDVLKTKRAPSKFAPGVEAIRAVLVCPTCHLEHEAAHSTTVCCRCGLHIHYGFGGVDVWRTVPTASPPLAQDGAQWPSK